MRPTTAAMALVATIMAAPLAMAQTQTAPNTTPPTTITPAPVTPAPSGAATTAPTPTNRGASTATAPAAGANSFTEGQARGRIEDAGFTNVTDLQKDEQGVWRGRATRNGAVTPVAVDYQGNVVAGSAPAR